MRAAFVLLAACLLGAGAAAQGIDPRDPETIVPLPAVLEMTAPAPDVPDALRRFHGAWAGLWGEDLRHVLIVEQLRADGSAQIVYALADSARSQVARAWYRAEARLEGDSLVYRTPGPPHAVIAYRLDGGDRLAATYALKSGSATPGLLVRAAPQRLQQGTADFAWPRWGESVRVPHATLPGVTLEATFYPPRGAAAAPLALFNHGSDIGADLRRSFSEPVVATWLQAQGYAVLVPMRRGRGMSGGRYGEGDYQVDRMGRLVSADAGIAEAVEDLAAAIAHGRTLPGVAPGPVLLLGQSRGGFLAVAYAGRHPQEVRGVISFAGGWLAWSEAARNAPHLAKAGAGAGQAVPQLWLYGARDSHFDETSIKAGHDAFAASGGRAQLEILRDIPGDGHRVKAFVERWRPLAEAFLAGIRR